MAKNLGDIPSEIISEAKKYFAPHIVSDAIDLFYRSRISISFVKGDPDSYFVVSGLITDARSHETKLVFKKHLSQEDGGQINSNCNCHNWTLMGYCPHVVCLYFHYLIEYSYNQQTKERSTEANYPPVPTLHSHAVNVLEYGTILTGPYALQGAPSNARYTSLRYLLHSNKIINFPTPQSFRGKLIIAITSKEQFVKSEQAGALELPTVRFKYLNKESELVSNISIFENIYLFNWNSGEIFDLPSNLIEVIRKFMVQDNQMDINSIIQMLGRDELHDVYEVLIDGKALSEINRVHLNTRIELNTKKKKHYIEFSIVFYDDQNVVYPPSDFMRAFCFTDGMLSSFKRKIDAYDFMKSLCASLKSENSLYAKELMNNLQKDRWIELITALTKKTEMFVYNPQTKSLGCFDNNFQMAFFIELLTCFDETFFRFSEYNTLSFRISYLVPAKILFQGISQFNNRLSPYSVDIYYDMKEVSSWKSKISFERRQETLKWFDLCLNIPESELLLIKAADLEKGVAVTSAGLTLLSEDNKELLKFVKKYTKHEVAGADGDQAQGQEKISKFLLQFKRARIFELFQLKNMGLEGALTQQEQDLCLQLSNLSEMPHYKLPEYLTDVVRPYQKTGFVWLRFLYESYLGACLADDMGLGKTLQTIAFIKSIYDEINQVLVVCPVSLLLNWENELQKFSDMNSHIYHGGGRNFPKSEDVKIVLTSYGVMKKEIDTTFANKKFEILILDEVQQLKNIRSVGAYAARKINARFRICITGTPVENDLAEFYNILDLCIPGIWGDLRFIRASSTKQSRLWARKTAGPFILRRTKAQVLTDLPPKIENNVYLTLGDEEQEQYKETLVRIRRDISDTTSKRRYGEILKGILQLRQCCLWQRYTQENQKKMRSTKVQFLVEQLEQIIDEGHQAIVFSQFTTYLDIIQHELLERHWSISRIDGTQSMKKRQAQVDEFQAHKTSVFLISLKAGGVGLNLTAASYVFVMDPWWNPAVETQAIDRAHRIGQTNTLTVYRPIVVQSVEEKVMELQKMKRQLFLDLLPEDDDSYFTGKLTMKDFEMLFS